ncbi:hypothetical protein Tco_0177930, partial [Tanacetum coccineum]
MEYDEKWVTKLKDRLLNGVKAKLDGVVVNGSTERRYAGNLNLSFAYAEGESLLMGLKEVVVSSGSACTTGGETSERGQQTLPNLQITRPSPIEIVDLFKDPSPISQQNGSVKPQKDVKSDIISLFEKITNVFTNGHSNEGVKIIGFVERQILKNIKAVELLPLRYSSA